MARETKAERAAADAKAIEQAFGTLTRDIIRADRGGADGLRRRRETIRLSRERYDVLAAGRAEVSVDLEGQLVEAERVLSERFALIARERLPEVIDHWHEGSATLEPEDEVARRAVMAECVELFLGFVADG